MANIPEFKYAPMFQLGEDKTEYRLLTKEGVSVGDFEGKEIVKVTPEALELLAQQAFHDVEFMLRREHNEQVAAILNDPEASENDKYVALQFLRNAETAAKGILFDLPEGGQTDGEPAELVALVMPLRHETVVFFDDARYLLGDAASVRSLSEQIAERVSRSTSKTLLVLVDRRVRSGDVMGLATIARQGGVQRLLFAEKSQEASE